MRTREPLHYLTMWKATCVLYIGSPVTYKNTPFLHQHSQLGEIFEVPSLSGFSLARLQHLIAFKHIKKVILMQWHSSCCLLRNQETPEAHFSYHHQYTFGIQCKNHWNFQESIWTAVSFLTADRLKRSMDMSWVFIKQAMPSLLKILVQYSSAFLGPQTMQIPKMVDKGGMNCYYEVCTQAL